MEWRLIGMICVVVLDVGFSGLGGGWGVSGVLCEIRVNVYRR
jgi:chromate transport protein ChrA